MPGFSGVPRRKVDRLRRERELADAIAAKVPRFNTHQVEEVDKLEYFLKKKFPRDLLMPVTHDTKKPGELDKRTDDLILINTNILLPLLLLLPLL